MTSHFRPHDLTQWVQWFGNFRTFLFWPLFAFFVVITILFPTLSTAVLLLSFFLLLLPLQFRCYLPSRASESDRVTIRILLIIRLMISVVLQTVLSCRSPSAISLIGSTTCSFDRLPTWCWWSQSWVFWWNTVSIINLKCNFAFVRAMMFICCHFHIIIFGSIVTTAMSVLFVWKLSSTPAASIPITVTIILVIVMFISMLMPWL